MEPTENNLEYSQESQNWRRGPLRNPPTEQREEQEAAAQLAAQEEQAAAEEAPAEAHPVQQQFQQAADSSGEGLGQIVDAVGGAIQGISRDRTEEEDAERVAGQGGQVRDVAGAVSDVVEGLQGENGFQQAQDAVASFLGLRSEEESQELRQQGQEATEAKQEASRRGTNPAKVIGSNGALSLPWFAELVVTSPRPSPQPNIVPYDAKDNPSTSTTGLAGARQDELGAQTPVGKIAQGFGEFGVVFMSTGGGAATANLFRGGAPVLALSPVLPVGKPLRVSWLTW